MLLLQIMWYSIVAWYAHPFDGEGGSGCYTIGVFWIQIYKTNSIYGSETNNGKIIPAIRARRQHQRETRILSATSPCPTYQPSTILTTDQPNGTTTILSNSQPLRLWCKERTIVTYRNAGSSYHILFCYCITYTPLRWWGVKWQFRLWRFFNPDIQNKYGINSKTPEAKLYVLLNPVDGTRARLELRP